jgi:hypothetical protein
MALAESVPWLAQPCIQAARPFLTRRVVGRGCEQLAGRKILNPVLFLFQINCIKLAGGGNFNGKTSDRWRQEPEKIDASTCVSVVMCSRQHLLQGRPDGGWFSRLYFPEGSWRRRSDVAVRHMRPCSSINSLKASVQLSRLSVDAASSVLRAIGAMNLKQASDPTTSIYRVLQINWCICLPHVDRLEGVGVPVQFFSWSAFGAVSMDASMASGPASLIEGSLLRST